MIVRGQGEDRMFTTYDGKVIITEGCSEKLQKSNKTLIKICYNFKTDLLIMLHWLSLFIISETFDNTIYFNIH